MTPPPTRDALRALWEAYRRALTQPYAYDQGEIAAIREYQLAAVRAVPQLLDQIDEAERIAQDRKELRERLREAEVEQNKLLDQIERLEGALAACVKTIEEWYVQDLRGVVGPQTAIAQAHREVASVRVADELLRLGDADGDATRTPSTRGGRADDSIARGAATAAPGEP